MENLKHGFYSPKAVAEGNGTSFWTRADGSEVEVSCVCESEVEGRRQYKWEDAEYRGPVVAWKRPGLRKDPDKFPQQPSDKR